jgi:hypothetical protein
MLKQVNAAGYRQIHLQISPAFTTFREDSAVESAHNREGPV